MGFPVPYSDLPTPKHLLHLLFFLAFLRRLISSAFHAIGLGDLVDSDGPCPEPPNPTLHAALRQPESRLASAMLIKEILPSVRFDKLLSGESESRRRLVVDGCAFCLYEFELQDEVRRLGNCRHVFHCRCLDRWVEYGQRTCPLCRAALVDDDDVSASADDFYSNSSVLPPSPEELILFI